MAGLACADALVAGGEQVTLFDKARGAGGRMSTRRIGTAQYALQFDHGAQYFTARDPAFLAQVHDWAEQGLAARWSAAGDDAWVGTPTMNAPVKDMARGHQVYWGTRIDALRRGATTWHAVGSDKAPGFDAVLIAVPAEQAEPLLAAHRSDFAQSAAASRSDPCWTLMAAFAQRLCIDADVLRRAGAISWAARDSAKPDRTARESWVIQASPSWSAEHLEASPDEVAPKLLGLFAAHVGIAMPTPLHCEAHRWRYARSNVAHAAGALWDADIRLGVCGDWLAAPRVEAAWLSGRQLAASILGT